MNVMKGEILFFRAGSRLAGRGYDEPRIGRIKRMGFATQVLACRTQNNNLIASR